MLFKRIIMLLLSLSLLLAACPAMSEENRPTYVMAGFDNTNMRQWENNRFFIQMEDWTGISFSFQQYTDAAKWKEYKSSLTAEGDMPDVLFKAALTQAECMDLLNKGVLIDLKPLMPQYAPNLWAILQERPEALSAITLPDGRIAALPYINTVPAQNYVWINRTWLNALKMDMPATAEELVEVLTAFKTHDLNKNGRLDEIPLGFLGPFDLKFLAHGFGLICTDYNVFEQDGKVKFMPLEENYRLFVTWCRDLYQAGLLDKNGFSIVDSSRQVTDGNAKPTYGAIMTTAPNNLFRVSWADDYTAMPPLFYNGQQVYRDFFGPVQRGTFAVTSHCGKPEEMLRWVDMLYAEKGAILATAGMENLDYFMDGDGTWRLADAAKTNGALFVAVSLMDGGASMPGIAAEDFALRYSGQTEESKKNYEAQKEMASLCRLPMPYLSLTEAQEKEIDALQNEIGPYVDIQLGRWVLGEEEITDESFAAFEQTLNEKGLPAFLALWQEALDAR